MNVRKEFEMNTWGEQQKYLLFVVIALFTILSLVLPATLTAQSAGKLTGTATDATGSVVSNASVTLTEASTQTKYRTVTSGQGIYAFPEVAPGVYNLSITAPTFKEYSQSGITIAVGQATTVNITLSTGAATETVTVNADASQLQTESSD